jgi:hypothetical protein
MRLVGNSVKRNAHSLKIISHQFSCICGLLNCVPSCPATQAQNWQEECKDSLAPYLGSSWTTIDEMLDFAQFKNGDSVLDLGAG